MRTIRVAMATAQTMRLSLPLLGHWAGPLAKLIYIVRPTGCTTACKSVYTMERLDVGLHESNMLNSYNRLVQQENVCIHDAAGCTTGCTTGCIVYTDIFMVVQPVVQPVVQRVASCIHVFTLSTARDINGKHRAATLTKLSHYKLWRTTTIA